MQAQALAHRKSISFSISQSALIDWVLSYVFIVALVLIIRFGALGVVAFLGCGVLIAVRHPNMAGASLIRNGWLFAIPVLALLSTAWSDYPMPTLRAAIQFIITTIVSIWLAGCVRPKLLMSALVVALTSVTVACFIDGGVGYGDPAGDLPLVGLFDSKNQLALCAVIQLLSAIALLIDGSQPRLMRLFALGSIGLAPVALLAARSAGSLVFCFPAIFALLACRVFAALPRQGRLTVLLFAVVIGVPVLLAVASFFNDVGSLLDALGKDSTLTGRAYLWQRASEYIQERPILGVGYQAFWQLENSRAQELWYVNHVTPGGFNFHNVYYNTAVELGFIGLLLVIATFLWMLVRLVMAMLAAPKAPQFLGAGLFFYFLGISAVEAPLFYQFTLGTAMLCIAWCYFDARPRSRRLKAR